jgi:hypothetical protein
VSALHYHDGKSAENMATILKEVSKFIMPQVMVTNMASHDTSAPLFRVIIMGPADSSPLLSSSFHHVTEDSFPFSLAHSLSLSAVF